jgi:hypothetical protein
MDDLRPAPSCTHLRLDPGHRPDAINAEPDEGGPLSIIAYETSGPAEAVLYPMPPRRGWMDRSYNRFAYRCLPLVVANQMGWLVRNPITFHVLWNGGPERGDLQILVPEGQQGWAGWPPDAVVESHFGEAVLTFQLPFLFRTSPGHNLWIKGPANATKDGAQALEGIVESDWSHAPFTMNWKITRPYHTITFLEGEPICQMVPYPRGLVERFEPVMRPLATDAELYRAYHGWHAERGAFLAERGTPGTDANRRDWQKDYYQGKQARGDRFDEHQTAVKVKSFERREVPETVATR